VRGRGLVVALIAGVTIMAGAATGAIGAGAAVTPENVTRVALPDVGGSPAVIAGVIPPLTDHPATAAAKCREPECDVTYHGGPVQTSPAVYLLFWGPKWGESRFKASFSYVYKFFKGLGGGSWSATISQYGDKTGHPKFGKSQLRGAYLDTEAPPKKVGSTQLSGVVTQLAAKVHLKGTNVQVVVATQQGTCFSDGFAGSCGKANPKAEYCSYHSVTARGIPFLNLPYEPDAGKLCGQNLVNRGAGGRYDAFSIAGGHEYAETITDPVPVSGWIDLRDSVSGGEIADKCVFGGSPFGVRDPLRDVHLSTGSFAMQSLWSNKARRCVI
jgi:hypothetical protein